MSLLDLLFPRRCVNCGRNGRYFCKKCQQKIEFITQQICPGCARPSIDGWVHPYCRKKYSLDGMYTLSHYRGPIRQAIHLLKYQLVSDLVSSLVDFLPDEEFSFLPRLDLLIPVPLHPKRERERGFNQSYLLAKELGKRWQIKVDCKILIRKFPTKPQVDLKGEERRNNLKGVFQLKQKTDIKGLNLAIIDDVATTRSTLIECAKILKKNGAKLVWGIVLAHG